jgi:hypothetical protein
MALYEVHDYLAIEIISFLWYKARILALGEGWMRLWQSTGREEMRESVIQHLRSMTNDLQALADTMAAKIPALPPGPEEIKAKHWYQFWK